MDNTFILNFLENKARNNRKERIFSKIIKLFNTHNELLKLKFKADTLNRFYNIKYSETYDSKENMLQGLMTNVEENVNIYHLLTQIILLGIPGDVVELGCYEGTTAIIMQKTLDQLHAHKRIHVYDSFLGLPEKSRKDGSTSYSKGLCCSSKEQLIQNYKNHRTKLPKIHEGWFKDTLPHGLPKLISFAHLDSDIYSSILESWTYVYPRLAKGGIVVVDDYCNPTIHDVNNILPGVKKACDEYLKDKKETMNVLIAGCEAHGYLRKQ